LLFVLVAKKTILKAIEVDFSVHTERTPDQRIAWESKDGEYVAGIVTFEPIGTSRTRLNLKLFYDSKGSRRAEERFLSSAGDRVERDLERFRKFIEKQDTLKCRRQSGMKFKGGISKSAGRNFLHRPNPGPGPIPDPDPPHPPPHPFPTPPIPPEPPVSGA
jgi:hypothetical protein